VRAPEHLLPSDYELTWMPERREMADCTLTLHPREGDPIRIEFEKLFSFRMRGIGYSHPHWAHGSNHGELEVGGESIALADYAVDDPTTNHVQTLCKVRMGDREGIGVLEQIAIGPHAPTGLTGDGIAV
jgi:hypothetical protein